MEGIELIVAGAWAVYFGASFFHRRRSESRSMQRSEICIATGMRLGENGILWGEMKGFEVRMDVGSWTQIHLPRSMQVRVSYGSVLGIGHYPFPNGRSGDDEFDRTFIISGDQVSVAAFLHGRTRLRARAALEIVPTLEIADGVIRGGWPYDTNYLASARRCLNALLPLADALSSTHEDLPEQLRLNAKSDVDPKVRMHNLLLLIFDGTGAAAVKAACRERATDPDMAIACVALARVLPMDPGVALPAEDRILAVAENHREVVEARRSALRILERRGTLSSIERLRSIEADFAIRDHVERAIEQIQSRCGAPGTGHLSLAQPDSEGSVSIADGGGLWLPDE